MDGTVRKWLGLSSSRFPELAAARPSYQRWKNVDVRGRVRSRGNTRVSRVCIMQWRWSGALDASPSRSTRRGRKDEGGGAKRRRWRWNRDVVCLNRHATLVFPLLPSVSCLLSPWNTAAVSLLPTPLPPPSDFPRSRFPLFRSYPFFPPFLFVSFHNGGLPPSTPSTVASWPLVLARGLKCHSFSSCARFHAPKESLPPPSSLSFSLFFLLSLSLLLSSVIYLSIYLSEPCALAFVDRVILAPGRRQNQGKMGEWREEGRAIFGFLGTGNGNGEGGKEGGWIRDRVFFSFFSFRMEMVRGLMSFVRYIYEEENRCAILWLKYKWNREGLVKESESIQYVDNSGMEYFIQRILPFPKIIFEQYGVESSTASKID